VFFYQSPYGGRVFFDELGPPWPKHPCTDNSSIPAAISHPTTLPKRTRGLRYAWQRNGWEPCDLLNIQDLSDGVVGIAARVGEDRFVLLANSSDLPILSELEPPDCEELVFIREMQNRIHQLSVFADDGATGEITAFAISITKED
jgi:hypothetical protein